MKELLGVDFGTGGREATMIDLEGNILASAFQEYPSEYRKPGWPEQDPAPQIGASINTVTACRTQMNDGFDGMLGLAVTTSTYNTALLDGNGWVIRHYIMWNDQGSREQCRYLKGRRGEEIFRIGVQMPTPIWTLSQLQWVRENKPENYKKVRRLMFTRDYVRSWVTGDFCTDTVDAQGSLLFDTRKRCWSGGLCDMVGLLVEVLPEIRKTKEIVGTIREEVSKQIGLPRGLLAIVGCSDTAAEDLNTDVVKDDQIVIRLITAGNINLVTSQAVPHDETLTYPYSVEGEQYTVTATSSYVSAYRQMRDSLYPAEKEQCDREGRDVYLLMDKQATPVELGCQRLLFHPYLLGERCPYLNPNTRGDFFGVSMVHKKGHFVKALLEGIAFSLYDCLQVLKEFTDNMEDIVIIEGGVRSPPRCQIISNIFDLEVKMPQSMESSFGGTLLAGVGVGVFADELEAAGKYIYMKKTYYPDMKNHKKYMELFRIYKGIADMSSSVWEKLAESSA